MTRTERHSLEHSLATAAGCIAQSIGKLRVLAAGVPFTDDIVRHIEGDLVTALNETRWAREIIGDVRSLLGAEGER